MVTRKYVEKKVQKGSSGIPIEWDLRDLEFDFAKNSEGNLAIYGCGCSTFKNEGRLIKGTYNLVVDGEVEKSFTVFLDDGQPLDIQNNKGVMVQNKEGKRHVTLDFKLIPF